MPVIPPPIEQLQPLAGQEIGVSGWLEVDQDRIDRFVEATDDYEGDLLPDQWIHIDPERAAEGRFGATVAPGYLTLSLTVPLAGEVGLPVSPPPRFVLNYGLERVRFPAPIRAGSRVRARVGLESVSEVAGGIQVVRRVTVEIEGEDKPGMVALTVSRLSW